jgi:hypothetical protein
MQKELVISFGEIWQWLDDTIFMENNDHLIERYDESERYCYLKSQLESNLVRMHKLIIDTENTASEVKFNLRTIASEREIRRRVNLSAALGDALRTKGDCNLAENEYDILKRSAVDYSSVIPLKKSRRKKKVNMINEKLCADGVQANDIQLIGLANELVVLATRLLITKNEKQLSIEKLQETSYALADKVLSFHGLQGDYVGR